MTNSFESFYFFRPHEWQTDIFSHALIFLRTSSRCRDFSTITLKALTLFSRQFVPHLLSAFFAIPSPPVALHWLLISATSVWLKQSKALKSGMVLRSSRSISVHTSSKVPGSIILMGHVSRFSESSESDSFIMHGLHIEGFLESGGVVE